MRTRLAMLCSVVAVASILGVVPRAEADPVSYLGIGTASSERFFVGSCRDCYCGTCGYVKVDQFDFVIPPHTELLDITASFFFPADQYAASLSIVGPTEGTTIWYDPRDFGTCGISPCVLDNLHWGPGSYHVQTGDCWPPEPGMHVGPFICYYGLAFTVAPVPEPSALVLLAGLGGLVWWWHRRG